MDFLAEKPRENFFFQYETPYLRDLLKETARQFFCSKPEVRKLEIGVEPPRNPIHIIIAAPGF